MTPEQELAWLAGLLEGEGCFYTYKTRPGTRLERPLTGVTVTMVDRDVIEHVARLFDTAVYPRKPQNGGQPLFEAKVFGFKAVWIMKKVLPYMGARRREKIETLLAAYAPRRNRKIKPWPFYEAMVLSRPGE